MTSAGFDWSDSVIWEGPGAIAGSEERLSADRLERAQYARFLTNYLAAEGKQRNYVLNLNAEWGAGKTWFIKRWYMELKAHYPTVYIDAWQQDFSDDPLLTVISSIIEQLRDATGNKLAVPDGIKSKLLGLLKVGGKLVLKSAIKKAGLEDSDFSVDGEDADKLVDTLCSNHKERYEAIQYLTNDIREWVEAAVGLSDDKLDFPAFILIDELDRCRPSYAVEMLETIKHIFDVSSVVFVLATDTEQLQHAIKVIYGEGFDAQSYLRRFFNRRFTMKEMPKAEFIEYHLNPNIVSDGSLFPHFDTLQDLSMTLSVLVGAFGLQLRDVEQYIDKLKAIINNRSANFDLIILSLLLIVRDVDPDLYYLIVFKRFGTNFNIYDQTSVVERFGKIQIQDLISFYVPKIAILETKLHASISILTYLQSYFYAMMHRAKLVSQINNPNSQKNFMTHKVNGVANASSEVCFLVYHLAEQNFTLSDYHDLVELSCCLK
ncbi:P-loop NTPase fold protein [Aeromonas enteropelogenes]|uniref:KAP family P-loop NTPase fold protein n=1 Tax=Aeromonas enteropelogenes TaxID=29489 RepID=UPI0009EF0F98|nr:P-loop NTPase fold protein [Aeromonas enteropelogenes]